MICPSCGHLTHVISTRRGIVRRRECSACKYRFTTQEVVSVGAREHVALKFKYDMLKARLRAVLEEADALHPDA